MGRAQGANRVDNLMGMEGGGQSTENFSTIVKTTVWERHVTSCQHSKKQITLFRQSSEIGQGAPAGHLFDNYSATSQISFRQLFVQVSYEKYFPTTYRWLFDIFSTTLR